MRIALLGPNYPYRGGITHHTTLLARALRSAGHDLLFVSFSRQYPRLLYGRSDQDPSSAPLQEPAEFWLDSLNPFTWVQTAQRIRAWSPEKVIMPWWVPFWSPAWGVVGRLLTRGKNAPELIMLCHNVLPHEQSWLDVAAVRWALAPADRFIVHAQSQAELLQGLFHGRVVSVTPHPSYGTLAATGKNTPETAIANLPTDRPLLLFCGFVRPYKGLDTLLEAVALVIKSRPVHLAVVGEFWTDPVVYQTSLDKLGEHVTVVNAYVPNELLAVYVRRANVVVLPYKEATQSGIVRLAFGAGTPVITTAVGGLPEAVHPKLNGFIVPPNDPPALARAIERYFAEGWEEIMRNYLQEHETKFGWDNLVRAVEGVSGVRR
jgi:glycosyltransferase involved in cell wall biosynthesis